MNEEAKAVDLEEEEELPQGLARAVVFDKWYFVENQAYYVDITDDCGDRANGYMLLVERELDELRFLYLSHPNEPKTLRITLSEFIEYEPIIEPLERRERAKKENE